MAETTADARREALLATARQLLATRPRSEVTLAAIARAAGVSWGTVRRILGSRDDIFAELSDIPDRAPAPDTRRRILDAARRTFARMGYDGASIDEIAADAGLTKGAVYWHFSSKMDLFKAILLEQRTRELQEMPDLPALFAQADSPEEAWTQVLLHVFNDLGSNRDWIWLLFEFITSSREPKIRELLGEGAADIFYALLRQFQVLQAQGHLSTEISPEEQVRFWGSLVNGLAFVSVMQPEITERADRIAPTMAQLLAKTFSP